MKKIAKKPYVLSAFAVVIILSGSFFYVANVGNADEAASSSVSSSAKNPLTPAKHDYGILAVPAELTSCSQDSDCTLALNDCAHCCNSAALNKDKVKIWYETLKKHCSTYKGMVCNCMVTKKLSAICKNSMCEIHAAELDDVKNSESDKVRNSELEDVDNK